MRLVPAALLLLSLPSSAAPPDERVSAGVGRWRFTLPAGCSWGEGTYFAFQSSLLERPWSEAASEGPPELSEEGKPIVNFEDGGSHVATRSGEGWIRRGEWVLRASKGESRATVYLLPDALKKVGDVPTRLSLTRLLKKYRVEPGRGFKLGVGVIDRAPDGEEFASARFDCGGVTARVVTNSRDAFPAVGGATTRFAGALEGQATSTRGPLVAFAGAAPVEVVERTFVYAPKRASPARPHLQVEVSSSSDIGADFDRKVDLVFDTLLSSLTLAP